MSSVESLLNRPLAIAALTLLGSVGGGMLKDRLQQQGTSSANAVRIERLEREQGDTVREREFQQFMAEVLRRLESLDARIGDYAEIRRSQQHAK